MKGKSGISTYFGQDRIRIRYQTIEDLNYPEYIHIRINEGKKHLFIVKSERDMDAFRIKYRQTQEGKKVNDPSCYINARNFLEYLAGVIGVPADSPSLHFKGQTLPNGEVFIDLNHYEVIGKSGRHNVSSQDETIRDRESSI